MFRSWLLVTSDSVISVCKSLPPRVSSHHLKRRYRARQCAGSFPVLCFLAFVHQAGKSFVSQDLCGLQLSVPVDLASHAGVFTTYTEAPFWTVPPFLVDLGRRLTWVGRGHGGAYRNAGYASLGSCFMSHRTTNGDFRWGDQRAKLAFF